MNALFRWTFCSLAVTGLSIEHARAMGDDDPHLSMVKIDELEWRNTDGPDLVVFKGEGWVGHDLQKVWLKAEVERHDGTTDDIELQALYSVAVAPYWDAQLGVREDFRPNPSRTWAAIGMQGLVPYFFEVDAALFIGEAGRTALRLEAEYDLLFTQKLILSPQLEVNLYGKNDASTSTGSGLSDTEFGLRLRYEVRREFAPYIGVNWHKQYGNTADYARDDGDGSSDTSIVIGVRAWF